MSRWTGPSVSDRAERWIERGATLLTVGYCIAAVGLAWIMFNAWGWGGVVLVAGLAVAVAGVGMAVAGRLEQREEEKRG